MPAFVSMTDSITIFPASFLTAIEILSVCTSMPIYLVLVIKGVPPPERLSQALKPYSTRGALLYCVDYTGVTRRIPALEMHFVSRKQQDGRYRPSHIPTDNATILTVQLRKYDSGRAELVPSLPY